MCPADRCNCWPQWTEMFGESELNSNLPVQLKSETFIQLSDPVLLVKILKHVYYMCINLSLVRIFELRSVGGGKHLTAHYFGIGLRQCADRVIFPVGGMSGRLGEFRSPSLGNDPSPFAPQIFRSTLLGSKVAAHGPLEKKKERLWFSQSRSCVIL